jgi:hypothetical protein
MAKQTLQNSEIYVRDMTEADIPFIFNSWLKSFRNGLICKYVDNAVYFSEHHKLVEKLLKRSTTKIACNPTNPEDIYGYISYETIDGIFCLHYGYVKQTFRNLGIFRTLMQNTGADFKTAGVFSHSTPISPALMPKFQLMYHPYILINYLNVPAQPAVEVKNEQV